LLHTLKTDTRKRISLNGEWDFTLDPEEKYLAMNIGSSLVKSTITVPGSWEEQGFGEPSKHNPIGTWKKLHEYVGTAWYSKEVFITEDLKLPLMKLVISGVRWMTRVWINDQFVGEGESLVSDHVFDVTEFIKLGETNIILICVNNEMKYPLHDSHIHSYHTATNWGGITGGIYLEALPKTNIQDIKVYPRLENKYIEVEIDLKNSHLLGSGSSLSIEILNKDGEVVRDIQTPIDCPHDKLNLTIDLWEDVIYWDDQNPYFYHLNASIMHSNSKIDHQIRTLGIRSIKTEGKQILLNGVPKFLRGYVDCCIFPQTGYPSWNKQDYIKQFKTVKQYGFNHVRLHGWTPPKPFWEAADEEGMLVQTELPHWSALYMNRAQEPDQDIHDFLTRELYRVVESLNEHPSFVSLSPGNELQSTRA
jgi:beta-galactosidase